MARMNQRKATRQGRAACHLPLSLSLFGDKRQLVAGLTNQ
ncbi:hypothetical protein CU012_2499 [Enterococcus faecium]|nr:hypothetical protein [Enterococcus faecium]CVH54181.1 hypothetical protein EFE1165_63 [Enterococcus faecium]